MQEIVANVDHITFSIEKMLEQQTGAQALMFPGMDSKWSNLVSSWLLGYLVDKSSSPDGTTRINLLQHLMPFVKLNNISLRPTDYCHLLLLLD